ncbi:MAG: sulfite exporter TauE/SafE family protein [Vampirovibrio sp.]|nr:sulfite exporter TauE/SafE family protein [Vampirovibrio sp.]
MDETQLIVLAIGAAIAAWVGTIAGFGTGTLMTALLVLLLKFDTKSAILLVAGFHGVSSLLKTGLFFRAIDWKTVLTFGVPSLLLAGLGAYCWQWVPSIGLLFLLGGMLCLISTRGLQGKSLWVLPDAFHHPLLSGGLAGFITGLVGTGGAVRAFFLNRIGLIQEPYVATSAMIALMADISRLPVYWHLEAANLGFSFSEIGVVVAGGLAGILIGKRMVASMTAEKFQKGVYWALLVFGIYYVEKSVRLAWSLMFGGA